MGHFINHIAGSEPRTHRGGGKAAVRVLLKASAVGVQAWRRRGTAGVVDEERGHGRHGAPAWVVDVVGQWSSVGRCTGVGVEEEERGAGNGWREVEINLDNFNPRQAFIPIAHHCRF